MATQKNIIELKSIHAPDLYEYTVKALAAAAEGFEPCTKNSYIPQAVGHSYFATFVKYEEVEEEISPTKPPSPFVTKNADGISDMQKQKNEINELLGEDQTGKAVAEVKAAEPEPKRTRGRKAS